MDMGDNVSGASTKVDEDSVIFINSLISMFKHINLRLESELEWNDVITMIVSVLCAIVIAYMQHRINQKLKSLEDEKNKHLDITELKAHITKWLSSIEAYGISGNIPYGYYPTSATIKKGFYYIELSNSIPILPVDFQIVDSSDYELYNELGGLVLSYSGNNISGLVKLFEEALLYKKYRSSTYDIKLSALVKGIHSENNFVITVSFSIKVKAGYNDNCMVPLYICSPQINVSDDTINQSI